MYVHSFYHVHVVHVFERGRKAIEQHALMTLVLTLAIMLGIGYTLNSQSSRVELFQFSDASEAGIRLSRFANPQYAHEVAAREQVMMAALTGLLSDLQADRAYLAVYGLIEDFWVEYQVISVLEVTKTGVAPDIQRLQGIGRSSWLQMEDNAYRANWFSTENVARVYGLELYDEQGVPVGYLGMEKTQETWFAEQDIQRVREIAEMVSTAIVKPLEQVKGSL